MVYILLILAYFAILLFFSRFFAFLKGCDDSMAQTSGNIELSDSSAVK
ncbi:MAG: hypothetical protein WCI84_03520 [Bacteroidota bacterium]